jgi:hypothetical protein
MSYIKHVLQPGETVRRRSAHEPDQKRRCRSDPTRAAVWVWRRDDNPWNRQHYDPLRAVDRLIALRNEIIAG